MARMIEKVIRYISDKNYRFTINSSFHLHDKMSDKEFICKQYKASFGLELNLNNPTTFNEKLQWLKLHMRDDRYTQMVDKYGVRDYIAQRIGSEYLIPLLGVWDNPDNIDFESLPNQFVLKCTHNSGVGMCICKDKGKINIPRVKKELRKGLNENYYIGNREWPYKNVVHRIIAEKYMDDGRGQLRDYKLHCFNGKCKIILVCDNRFSATGVTEDFYNTNWEHLDIKRPGIMNSEEKIEKPDQLIEMIDLAEKISEGLAFSRIDFYVVNKKIYFGEITFFPASGFKGFEPETWDAYFGSLLNIEEIT